MNAPWASAEIAIKSMFAAYLDALAPAFADRPTSLRRTCRRASAVAC